MFGRLIFLATLATATAAAAQTTNTVSPVVPRTCVVGEVISGLDAAGNFICGIGGIAELIGSVLAGPGVGSQAATLAAAQPDAHTWSATQTFTSVLGTVKTETGTADTLDAADCGKIIRYTNAANITVTLPDSLPAGCSMALIQRGAGQIIPTVSGGATLTSARGYTKSFGLNAMIGLTIDSNAGGTAAAYIFSGDGAQ